MFLLVVAGPVMALATAPRADGDVMLVIVPPWLDSGAMVSALGGRVIGPERAPFGVLIQSDHPDLAHTAQAAGAWWVVPADALAAICGVKT